MTSRTHDIFAFASLVTVAVYNPPGPINITTAVAASIGSIVGSLLPDIDQSTNRLWDLIPAGHFFGKVFRNILLSHRTISHSLLGIFVANKFFLWLLPKLLNDNFVNVHVIYISIMVGFISHIVIDAFTEEGIPLFFPLKWKIGFPPISSWRIKTGKWFEKFVVFPGIVAYLILFVSTNQDKLMQILKLAVK